MRSVGNFVAGSAVILCFLVVRKIYGRSGHFDGSRFIHLLGRVDIPLTTSI